MTNAGAIKDLCESVEKLRPLITQHSRDSDRQRRLATPVLEALRDAGFFRMFRPKSRGGLELRPTDEFKVAESLARIDSAAAWNVQICNASELFGGWFGDDATVDTYGSDDVIVAGSFNPHRRAVPVEGGGYRITGRTPFTSNCHGASWLIGLADVFDGDEMRLDANGQPETLLTLNPADDFEIIENWETLGMSGTGSHDVDVQNVFVPNARAVPFIPRDEPSPAYATPLHPLAVWATVGGMASVALGIAQSAIDELVERGSKVPAYTENALRNRSTVQLRLARANGKIAAARELLHSTYDAAWSAATANGRLSMDEKARCQLATSHVVLEAVEAVQVVHSCVGTAGIRNEERFQKHFRDVHVISQHAFICETRLEAVGQVMLGLEPDWAFFSF